MNHLVQILNLILEWNQLQLDRTMCELAILAIVAIALLAKLLAHLRLVRLKEPSD